MKKYIVIVVAHGDSERDGKRLWFQEFQSRKVAQDVQEWLDSINGIDARMIVDEPESGPTTT
jgi:hypothetical protein